MQMPENNKSEERLSLRILSLCVALVLLALLPQACEMKRGAPEKEAAPAVSPSAGVSARYVSGKAGLFTVEAFKGQPLLLSIQGADTPYLSANLQELERLNSEWGPRGVAVVALLTAFADGENAEEVASEARVSYPIATSSPDFLKSLGSVRALPTMVLVDNRGVMRKQYPGAYSADDLNTDLQSLVTGQ